MWRLDLRETRVEVGRLVKGHRGISEVRRWQPQFEQSQSRQGKVELFDWISFAEALDSADGNKESKEPGLTFRENGWKLMHLLIRYCLSNRREGTLRLGGRRNQESTFSSVQVEILPRGHVCICEFGGQRTCLGWDINAEITCII